MSTTQDRRLALVVGEVQPILSEKRTALSLLRTGIAVFALPLSALSLLVATSRYYSVRDVLGMLFALLVLCGALTVLGVFLVVRAVRRIHAFDDRIRGIKAKYRDIAPFLE